MKNIILAATLLSTLALPLAAQSADKPNYCKDTTALSNRTTITGSACTLMPSKAAVEAGYRNVTVDGLGNVVTSTETSLRVGTFLPGLEANLSVPSKVRAFGNTGVSDLGFGAKYALRNEPRYAVATRASVNLPTGQTGLSTNSTSYSAGLVGTYLASPALKVSASTDAQALSNGVNKYGATREAVAADVNVYRQIHLTGGYGLQTNALGPKTNSRPTYQAGLSEGLGDRFAVDFEVGRDQKVATGQDRYAKLGVTFKP